MRITKAQGKGGGAVKAGGMPESVVLTLMKCLAHHNPYAKLFMTAREVLAKNNALSFKLKGVPRAGCNPKRYNQPTVDEVAAIVQGSRDVIGKRQFLLHQMDGDLRKISDMSSAYLPLRYPLSFPHGEQQWDNLCCVTTSQSVFLFHFSLTFDRGVA
jgi:hypothetical protein